MPSRLLLALALVALAAAQSYKVGVGIYDVTGTAAQVGMMGYAMPQQKANGIHFRQRARAFLFADAANDTNRVVFVSSDVCMTFQEVKAHVVDKLQGLFPGYYSLDNVMLSATHTHSGPAGFAYYVLYDVSSFGFIADNFNAIVGGIVQAIAMAHNNLQDGNVYLDRDYWPVANWTSANRSPSSYLLNPDANLNIWTDTNMTLLRIQNANGSDLGMVNWFAVHGTAMNNTNGLISGDNKGYSSYMFERMQNGNPADGVLPGMGPFVAAFAQANEGDVSPNTMGAHCPDGTPCSWNSSTCNGRTEMCRATGPGATDFETCQIIGERILNFSLELWANSTQKPPLSGPLNYIHQWIPMYNITVQPPFTWDGQPHTSCIGALGDGFAGGTTDGPGAFNFKQNGSNPFWNFLGNFLSEPSAEERACQAPKSILLNVGGMDIPAPWAPNILPFQIFRLDNLFILAIPGEVTTQSGRRLKGQMEATLRAHGINNGIVVLAGLSNSYSHYIATPEEYLAQRYEAASTLYGRITLGIYLQEFTRLMENLLSGTPVSPGPPPPNLNQTWTFLPPVLMDRVPSGVHFGGVKQDVSKVPYVPGDIVTAIFYGANPRNNLHTQGSFLYVERLEANGTWTAVAVDGDWETKFMWRDAGGLVSEITVEWDIPTSPEPSSGTYRLRYTGDSKSLDGTITPFEGLSSEFTVQAS